MTKINIDEISEFPMDFINDFSRAFGSIFDTFLWSFAKEYREKIFKIFPVE